MLRKKVLTVVVTALMFILPVTTVFAFGTANLVQVEGTSVLTRNTLTPVSSGMWQDSLEYGHTLTNMSSECNIRDSQDTLAIGAAIFQQHILIWRTM